MNSERKDKYLTIVFGVLLFCLALATKAQVQNDSLALDFQTNFNRNVFALRNFQNELNKVKVQSTHDENAISFNEQLKKLGVFSGLELGAEDFYEHIKSLNHSDKQNLISSFLLLEKQIELELETAGLPIDFKYLAPAMSAMNTNAVGKNKCAGIWHLQHFQGILNGLQINSLVDERLNSAMATKAAVLQLQQNNKLFENAELAILAYLAGNTKLRNTLNRLGDFYSLNEVLNELPVDVTCTLSAYQAMAVFLSNYVCDSLQQEIEIDELTVNKQVHFKQIAQVVGCSEEQLQTLNPQYKFGIIPGDKKAISIKVPVANLELITNLIDSIYGVYDSTLFQVVAQKIEYPPAPHRQYVGEKVKDLEIEGKTKIKYTIKSGDVLGFIAEEYDVRVADLKYWNNIYNERRIQAGKQLDIFVDDDMVEFYKKNSKVKSVKQNSAVTKKTKPNYEVTASARKVEHTVKSGESPYVIAKKYDGVTPEAILFWNGISDARKIQIGQKLIIYTE